METNNNRFVVYIMDSGTQASSFRISRRQALRVFRRYPELRALARQPGCRTWALPTGFNLHASLWSERALADAGY